MTTKLRRSSRPGPFFIFSKCAHFWAYFLRDIPGHHHDKDKLFTFAYETGKTMPVGNCCYCFPSAYLLEWCPDWQIIHCAWHNWKTRAELTTLPPYSICQIPSAPEIHVSEEIRAHSHYCPERETALKQLFHAVEFTAQKDVSLSGIFIFTPSLDTSRDSQVCAEIWCQPTFPVVFIDVYRGLLCPLVV